MSQIVEKSLSCIVEGSFRNS